MSDECCIFCFKAPSNTTPFCPVNPGHGCTYGMHHEFPEGAEAKAEKPKPTKKIDKQVCTKCGLHARNPVSATNGCPHEYPQ